MPEDKIISAITIDELLQKVDNDLSASADNTQYHITLSCDSRRLLLDVTQSSVTISSYLFSRNEFRFQIHNQGAIDQIGKLFGMQDVVLGYKEFDDKFIIKSNDEQKLAGLFADGSVRNSLSVYDDISLGVVEYMMENTDGKVPFLELKVNKNVPQANDITTLLSAFYKTLLKVEA